MCGGRASAPYTGIRRDVVMECCFRFRRGFDDDQKLETAETLGDEQVINVHILTTTVDAVRGIWS